MKFLNWLIALAAVMILSACGGGGGSGGNSLFTNTTSDGSTTVPAPAVATLVLDLAGVTSISNSGSDAVIATVTAKDSANLVLKGVKVSFAVDSGDLTVTSDVTDGTGKTTARIVVGDDKSNRTIQVTATSGDLVQVKSFKVTGTKIKSTVVPSVLRPGEPGQVQYQVVDVNGNPMPKQSVTISGGAGSTQGLTDSNGVFLFAYTSPATPGTLEITAVSGGVSQKDQVSIQSSTSTTIPAVAAGAIKSAFVEANPSVVAVNESGSQVNRAAIRALFTGDNNASISNVRVRFDLNGDANSVGGTFSTGSSLVYSDTNGEAATFYIPATKASPTDGVTVRACYGYTDAEMANNACPNRATVTVTVVSGAISVSIGTNNLLIDVNDKLQLAQDFVVTVNDSAGRAKAGVDIVPSIDLVSFGKGAWSFGSKWSLIPQQYFYAYRQVLVPDPSDATKQVTVTYSDEVADGSTSGACWNEDRNRNGILEGAEDSTSVPYSKTAGGNGNGTLEPRKSNVLVTVNGGVTGKTDSTGSAVVRITYARNLAGWLKYNILVAAGGISGTEGRANWEAVLKVPLADIELKAEPAFATSPFGVLAGCDNPR